MKKIIIIFSSIIVILFIILMIFLFNTNSKDKDNDNDNDNDNDITEVKEKETTENVPLEEENEFSKLSYYKDENLDRYKSYQTNNPNLSIEDIVTRVNLNLDKSPYTDTIPSINLNTNYLLVNKFNYLGSDYIPNNLELLDNSYAKSGIYLVKEAKDNIERLIDKAKNDGMNIRVISAYRSYSYQENLYNNYVKNDGVELADTYSARPGYSEHQTGLVVDVTRAFDNFNNFENTNEYNWMLENAANYGFILRYPKDKENITTYSFEAWHYRYVGVELAQKIKASNLTFDEYYVRYLESDRN